MAGQATSRAVTLTVQQAPAVSQQPVSVTVEEGQSAVFEAAATGSPAPTIKWEASANGGATWTTVSGATSNRLTIAGATASLSGREYRAALKNAVGEALSAAATLTAQKAPAITKQPASVSVEEGQSATFEATASGFPAPSVQWEVSTDGGGSWSAVEGATSTRLTIAGAVVAEDGRKYRAAFANAAGAATSAAATLTVGATPLITQQPLSTTIELGEGASFEAAVKFGAAQASSFVVNSASSITATAPPGVGTVDVTVVTPSGTSPVSAADRFTFQNAPTVSKLSLKSGAAAGGAQVTITGSEFTAASRVAFGSTSASQFTVVSPTSITAVAPPGAAGRVDVSVTNTAGTSAVSSKDRFTYTPSIEGLAPDAGPAAGGTSVTVTGAGFALGSAGTAFKFGSTKAKSVDCTSSTTCVVAAPAHAAGAVDVTATVAKATSAVAPASDRYTYE